MAMKTVIVGIKPPDNVWEMMKAVWDTCSAAGLSPPPEVLKFFNHEKPDPKGVIIDLMPPAKGRKASEAVTGWQTDTANGFEVELEKIPKDIKILRFFNSW